MAPLHTYFFRDNESFAYEALRAASYAHCGGAELAEVISICSRIPSKDEDSWLREWKLAGDRAVETAKTSLTKNNRRGAQSAFLRASNYYRTAEFYRRDNVFEDKLSNELMGLSTEAFYSATKLMPYRTEKVKIPYEGTTLPATIMQPDTSNRPGPTIIFNGGFDSTRGEVFYMNGQAALDQGFNIILFDGPGQGEALREQRLFFRNDWETVVTSVVDFALDQPTILKDKLFLMGISMGGYLVGRALCFEYRCAAAIVNDGVYDFGSAFHNQNPALGKFLIQNGWDATMNTLMRQMMHRDTGFKWAISNGMWAFGVQSPVEVMRCVRGYTLEGLVDNIKTPLLVLDALEDHFLKGQPKALFDRLLSEKEFEQFTEEEGATAHCHMGSLTRLNQAIFDYLLPRVQ
ncbi:dipeptidyl aminopeptidase/acylaminoacyl peptidase [Colletotrichum asianum]|uniref:Dipeptidyl aminopeptidase acylaminoacyl-peptidase related protein n=1 Tax=Colletotrichum asianum TaxID=702518 RepID=A0A8H3ZSU3_9PEZI|nr:dipeptidyl aminopeptidase acylaminoacyl-peptidase related protein [Colletotrichum asianum]